MDDYAQSDHEARENDPYAAAKYRLTIRWLRSAGRLGDEIFNIGCGFGDFTAMAADSGARVRGFEPDPVAYRHAAASCPRGCTVEPLGLADIPGKQIAPVIVMHDVLEHIGDDAQAAADLFRLLKPDGLLVLSVPALPLLFGYHDEQLGHYRRYTRATLVSTLEEHFEIDRIRYYGMTLIPLALWMSRIRRQPYSSGTASPLLAAFDAACRVEERIWTPIGTSLICLARPRRVTRGSPDSGQKADR
jgi:SAM-dependent methyltransferase